MDHQDGEFTNTTDETPARQVRLRLRRVEWPFGTNRPFLTLDVLEEGNDRPVPCA
jgi:hypothetical protein